MANLTRLLISITLQKRKFNSPVNIKSFLLGIALFILQSCHAPYQPFKVILNYEEVPHLQKWGYDAQELIRIWAPQIGKMLAMDTYPREIHLTLVKSEEGIAFADSNSITVSSHWIEKHPEDMGLIVHETVHVVQLYPAFEPGWVTEGIADFIRWYKFEKKPLQWFPTGESVRGFEAAYRVTAGFFVWIHNHKHSGFIKLLNAEMKAGNYQEDIFKKELGKTVEALWEEYLNFRASLKYKENI